MFLLWVMLVVSVNIRIWGQPLALPEIPESTLQPSVEQDKHIANPVLLGKPCREQCDPKAVKHLHPRSVEQPIEPLTTQQPNAEGGLEKPPANITETTTPGENVTSSEEQKVQVDKTSLKTEQRKHASGEDSMEIEVTGHIMKVPRKPKPSQTEDSENMTPQSRKARQVHQTQLQEDDLADNVTAENVTAENVTAENVTAENVTAENVTAENVTAENVTGQATKIELNTESTIANRPDNPLQNAETLRLKKSDPSEEARAKSIYDAQIAMAYIDSEIIPAMRYITRQLIRVLWCYHTNKCVTVSQLDNVQNRLDLARSFINDENQSSDKPKTEDIKKETGPIVDESRKVQKTMTVFEALKNIHAVQKILKRYVKGTSQQIPASSFENQDDVPCTSNLFTKNEEKIEKNPELSPKHQNSTSDDENEETTTGLSVSNETEVTENPENPKISHDHEVSDGVEKRSASKNEVLSSEIPLETLNTSQQDEKADQPKNISVSNETKVIEDPEDLKIPHDSEVSERVAKRSALKHKVHSSVEHAETYDLSQHGIKEETPKDHSVSNETKVIEHPEVLKIPHDSEVSEGVAKRSALKHKVHSSEVHAETYNISQHGVKEENPKDLSVSNETKVTEDPENLKISHASEISEVVAKRSALKHKLQSNKIHHETHNISYHGKNDVTPKNLSVSNETEVAENPTDAMASQGTQVSDVMGSSDVNLSATNTHENTHKDQPEEESKGLSDNVGKHEEEGPTGVKNIHGLQRISFLDKRSANQNKGELRRAPHGRHKKPRRPSPNNGANKKQGTAGVASFYSDGSSHNMEKRSVDTDRVKVPQHPKSEGHSDLSEIGQAFKDQEIHAEIKHEETYKDLKDVTVLKNATALENATVLENVDDVESPHLMENRATKNQSKRGKANTKPHGQQGGKTKGKSADSTETHTKQGPTSLKNLHGLHRSDKYEGHSTISVKEKFSKAQTETNEHSIHKGNVGDTVKNQTESSDEKPMEQEPAGLKSTEENQPQSSYETPKEQEPEGLQNTVKNTPESSGETPKEQDPTGLKNLHGVYRSFILAKRSVVTHKVNSKEPKATAHCQSHLGEIQQKSDEQSANVEKHDKQDPTILENATNLDNDDKKLSHALQKRSTDKIKEISTNKTESEDHSQHDNTTDETKIHSNKGDTEGKRCSLDLNKEDESENDQVMKDSHLRKKRSHNKVRKMGHQSQTDDKNHSSHNCSHGKSDHNCSTCAECKAHTKGAKATTTQLEGKPGCCNDNKTVSNEMLPPATPLEEPPLQHTIAARQSETEYFVAIEQRQLEFAENINELMENFLATLISGVSDRRDPDMGVMVLRLVSKTLMCILKGHLDTAKEHMALPPSLQDPFTLKRDMECLKSMTNFFMQEESDTTETTKVESESQVVQKRETKTLPELEEISVSNTEEESTDKKKNEFSKSKELKHSPESKSPTVEDTVLPLSVRKNRNEATKTVHKVHNKTNISDSETLEVSQSAKIPDDYLGETNSSEPEDKLITANETIEDLVTRNQTQETVNETVNTTDETAAEIANGGLTTEEKSPKESESSETQATKESVSVPTKRELPSKFSSVIEKAKSVGKSVKNIGSSGHKLVTRP